MPAVLNIPAWRAATPEEIKEWMRSRKVADSRRGSVLVIRTHLGPLPTTLALRVEIYRELGAWELMEEISRHLVETQPQQSRNWLNYAAARQSRSGSPDALEILNQAVQVHPENGEIRFALACYQSQMGMLDVAKTNLGLAIKLDSWLKGPALNHPELALLWDSFS